MNIQELAKLSQRATLSISTTIATSSAEPDIQLIQDENLVIDYVETLTDSKTFEDFTLYASKLGYSEGLVKQVISSLNPDSNSNELLERLISFHTMLNPNEATAATKRRRDATHLPRYMLVQDCFYKGTNKMPYWVWVKRETIQQENQ